MSSGAFGDETESTVLHEVDCFGNETDILSCSVSTFGLQSEHSASVICQGVYQRYIHAQAGNFLPGMLCFPLPTHTLDSKNHSIELRIMQSCKDTQLFSSSDNNCTWCYRIN